MTEHTLSKDDKLVQLDQELEKNWPQMSSSQRAHIVLKLVAPILESVDLQIAEAVVSKLTQMYESTEMFSDPYKIFGLLKDESRSASAHRDALVAKLKEVRG